MIKKTFTAKKTHTMPLKVFIAVLIILLNTSVYTQQNKNLVPAPDRSEGLGPYKRLVIRGGILIDGSGAPPIGPVDIVIEKNRIKKIVSVGYPGLKIDPKSRPPKGDYEINAEGHYILPGFIDLHAHAGPKKAPQMEYIYKLWLAHGVTSVRGVSLANLEFSLSEKKRSQKNLITAPRIWAYQIPGQGKAWQNQPIETVAQAKKWVRYIAKEGADGVKLFSHEPKISKALISEAKKLNLGTTAHLAQMGVNRFNTLDAAKAGLGTATHFYGLFESMYESHDIQPWPSNMNYNNEQHRFSQVAKQWNLVKPGSVKWENLLQKLLNLDITLDPTLNIYAASRDLMRAKNADWHKDYTLPSLWEFFKPNRHSHGSYWFYWTTTDEINWKKFYQVWMKFLNEYKNRGGRVTTGSDSGFIFKVYGFGYIEELEMLQEAGFHPLEVIRAATLHGAETLYKPSGKSLDLGMIKPGFLADLIIVKENPLDNLKVLYGTGAIKLNKDNKITRTSGIQFTIKDGIVYDAKALLEDVKNIVKKQKSMLGELDEY